MSVYYFYDGAESLPFRYLSPTRMVGQIPPPYETEMTSSLYLEFAIVDLEEGSTRGLVNAFGNAKRAFHLAVDILLHQYGLFVHLRKSKFPTKLGVLDDIGILPIRLIRNLNLERNTLEHEYAAPSKMRAEEAVDFTRLVVFATEKLVERTPHEVLVGWKQPTKHSLIQVHPQVGELRLFRVTAPTRYERACGTSYISGRIRTADGSKFFKDVKVAKNPWKVIRLTKTSKNEWIPIVRELVNIQRKEGPVKSHTDDRAGYFTIPVTIPTILPDEKTWHGFLDEVMNKRIGEDAKPNDSE